MWVVTGAAGFIGSAVADCLIRSGRQTIGIDDFSTGLMSNVAGLSFSDLHHVDVRDHSKLSDVLEKVSPVSGVVHCAGPKSVVESMSAPEEYVSRILGGTRSILRALVKAKIPKLVFSSSCTIYGTIDGPVKETDATQPRSPYAEAKSLSEALIREAVAASCGSLGATSLRYFNAIGRTALGGTDSCSTMLVPSLMRSMELGTPFLLHSAPKPTFDGTCLRDFVDVSDVADAHFRVIQEWEEGRRVPAALNIGTGSPTSIWEFIRTFEAVSGANIEIQFRGPRPGDASAVWADPSLAAKSLGWQASVGIEESLSRLLARKDEAASIGL
jgi:UDP-glucose 4-epimerase